MDSFYISLISKISLIDISKVIGFNPSLFNVSFYAKTFTTGIINGTARFFSSLLGGISNIITGGGQVKGDVEFYNDTYNDADNSGNSFSFISKSFFRGRYLSSLLNLLYV